MNKGLLDKTCSQKNSLVRLETTETEVLQVIRLLDKKTPGYDDISLDLIRLISHSVVRPLTRIVNLSFIRGEYPTCFKKILVIPIYKNGDNELIDNFCI